MRLTVEVESQMTSSRIEVLRALYARPCVVTMKDKTVHEDVLIQSPDQDHKTVKLLVLNSKDFVFVNIHDIAKIRAY